MIITTGATGVLGGAVVRHLLALLPPERIGVSVRDPSRAQHLADRGVRVRRATYDEPEALRRSFEGAEQVLIVSSSDLAADVLAQHRRAIDAAADAGASRILYTSAVSAGSAPEYPPAALHAATEAHLAASGAAWTSLRNGFYGPLDQLLGSWQETGVIAQPADGPFPWIDRRDAGEAAATLLASGTPMEGPVTLTGARTTTLEELAAHASALSGRTITRVTMEDEEWVDSEVAAGIPEAAARFTLGFFRATRSGAFAQTTPHLQELLGRAPRTPGEILAESIGR